MRHALETWLVESSRIVVDSDIARIVKERLSPERRTVIDAVMSSGRTLPEALAYRLLSRNDRADTPTADSRVFVSPPPPKNETPLVEGEDEASQSPTWRPPRAAGVPAEADEITRPPQSAFNDEAESTIRDRVPPGLIKSSPPKTDDKKKR